VKPPCAVLGRRGVTLVELSVVMVASLVLLAGAVPFLLSGNRALEQQTSVRQVQVGVHVAAEILMRGIRSAEAVLPGSNGARVVLEGGELADMCGDTEFWIEAGPQGLRCGPAGAGVHRVISAAVPGLTFEYGLDPAGDGIVEAFTVSPTDEQLEDALAVRFRLDGEHAFGRGAFNTSTEFVGVLRNPVLQRIEMP